MADNIKSFAEEAEALKKRMNVETVYDNPYFETTKEEAMLQHSKGMVSDQDANDWIIVNQLRDQGVWDLEKSEAQYAHERGFITDDQANAYIDYSTMNYDMNMSMGKYLLYELGRGRERDTILTEFEGVSIPMYGPEDLVADIATGGVISLMRTGVKEMFKQGTKQGLKTIGKSMALDAGFGVVAGGAMTGAEFVTDSGTVQLLSGLLTPLGASVVLGMGRNGLKQWLKSIKKNNPKMADDLKKIVAEAGDDEFTTLIRQELDEAAMEAVSPEFVPTKPKKADGLIEVADDANVVGLERLDRVSPEDAIKSVSIMKSIKEGTTIDPEAPPSKLVENIEARGDVNATDLIDEVRKTFADEIDVARGGKPDPKTGTRVDWKTQQAEADKELAKIAQWTGNRVQDMKKVVGYGENLEQAVRTVRRQTRAFNQVFSQYTDEINVLIKDARTFEEELKALKHIELFGKMTKSVYGVRSEWGRGLQAYNMPYMKSTFDFDSIPAKELAITEKSERARVQSILSGFKKAKNPRMKALRARNVNRGRFLLGMLEVEQAFLLSHPLTQAVNLAGNTGTLVWRNAAQYAATNVDAWKIAGGWRRPLTRDEMAMRSAHYQIQALRDGLVDSFYLPKGQMVDAFKQSRKQKAHIGQNLGDAVMNVKGVGKVWKSLWSGEAQLDNFTKYAAESKGALPDDLNDIMIPFGKGKRIGETRFKLPRAFNLPIGNIIRLPFHGLTAGDELFKTLNYRQSLHELAYREIMKSGGVVTSGSGQTTKFKLDPETIDQAVALQLKFPTDEMITEALKVSRRETFTNQLDQVTGGIEKALNAPVFGPLARMLYVPFFKVTVNLPKYALQQTPLGALSKWQKEAIKAGGKARYEVFARWTMGMTLMAAGAGLYSTGQITGRVPTKKRGVAEAANVQPYSWIDKDTGEQFDYSRIEPVAYLVGMSADISRAIGDTMDYLDPEQRVQADLELKDVMMSFLLSFTAPVMEKTVATSIKEGFAVVTDPERMNWDKWSVKQVEKFMPRIINFATEMSGHQDVMRESRSIMEAWNRKWGTLADENERAHPKRHIVYGTPVPREERAFGLVNKKTYTDDPVLQEMWRVGANPLKLADKFSVDGIEVDISENPELYDKIQDIIAASDMKEYLSDMIKEDWYILNTDQKDQAKAIMTVINEYRRDAREEAFEELPEFKGKRQEYEKDFQRELDIILGKEFRKDKDSMRNYWSDFLNLKGE